MNSRGSKLCRKQNVIVDAETVETDVERVKEEINDGEDSIVILRVI